jgi:SecD/SecF fusion protein
MQNKGAITFLAILLAIASIYQLSFTFATWRVKQQAQDYAKGDYQKEQMYLDSVANNVAYPLPRYTFRECQEREMNLGLDLKGGMNVILEVSISDLIINLSDNNPNPTFREAIKRAKIKQKSTQQDFITLFYESFKEIDPNAQLSAVFGTYSLKDRIKFDTSDEDVLKVLREEAQGAIDNSLNVLRSRIDKFGVVQPSIQKLEGNSGRILIELPGVKEPKRVRKLLQGTANLQFWETYYYPEVYGYFLTANEKLKEIYNLSDKDTTKTDSTQELNLLGKQDSLKKDTGESLLAIGDTTKVNPLIDNTNNELKEKEGFDQYQKDFPLFALLSPYLDQRNQPIEGSAVGFAHTKDTAKVNEILRMSKIKSVFPKEMFLKWEVKAFDDKGEYFRLVALKAKRAGKPALEGNVIVNARQETDPVTGEWQVSMTMNSDGANKWALITKENVGRQIAIVLDDYVYSSPVVNQEITGGSSQISGNFTQDEATDLANILKSGKLDAPAVIIEEEVIGPSLGKESVQNGMYSFILAFILVLIYMAFYYKGAGVVANVALITNIFLMFGVLASLRAVLTLPGIAGIVLTLGMAVDANVIIYERIKEELRLGKGLKLAISDGYKNAYSAIIDGNLTTLITGIILYIFGHGPIQGFATTLIIGILTSLFTAIFISRIIISSRLENNKPMTFSYKYSENVFKNVKFDFIGKRKIAYLISGTVIIVTIISLFTKGLNFGVDFQGGRTYIVQFHEPVVSEKVADALKVTFGDAPEVKAYGTDDQVKIVTKFMIDSDVENADDMAEQKLFEGLKNAGYIKEGISYEMFSESYTVDETGNYKLTADSDNDANVYGLKSSRKVGPTIADDIKTGALWALIFSILGIFVYIFIRFRNWQFGIGVVAALIHDAIFVIGMYSLLYTIMPFSLEVNQAFIAAVLTVIGYSVNDTVIIYDRIREYLQFSKSRTRKDIFNGAMNSTLGRTMNTSLTTLVVLFAIFAFGGEAIRGFIFALMIGIIVGTYSSIFVAAPFAYDTIKKKKEENALDKKKIREYLGGKK